MFLTRFGLDRPVVVRLALILIIIFGIYGYVSMPRYLDPDITVGEGIVVTVCPGFSPEEMEKLVTNKIEKELDGISEIRKYESHSFESTSKIRISFNTELSEYGVDQAMQELAHVRLVPGFHDIYHYNGRQTVRLTANIRDEAAVKKGLGGFLSNIRGDRMTSVKANAIARRFFDRIKTEYPGTTLIAGGLQDETNKSLRELGNAAILALFLIFFILALQFNSFTQPLIIMITIPFVTLGVMVGLLVSNNPLTFVTLIGLLTLSGIVVNDSLVLIDFINRYRKEHPKQLYRAIVRGCHVRMRPIILTSLTTIFGLAPMAFGIGGKSIFWAPLATAIMWGLGFGTALILSMVPAYYAILEDMRYLIRHRRRRKADTLREIEEAFGIQELKPYLKKTSGETNEEIEG